MQAAIDNPVIVGLSSLVGLWLASWVGLRLTAVKARLEGAREDFRVVEGATLTLLVLIIGFTFSMSAERYSQRKNLEEEEANAIGTEYVRADLLPSDAAAKVRKLLVSSRAADVVLHNHECEGAREHQRQNGKIAE